MRSECAPLRIGDAYIVFTDSGLITHFASGLVEAEPNYAAEDVARARALGYGGSRTEAVVAMTKDHDVLHSLVAHTRGQSRSAVLYGQATGHFPSQAAADEEERLVMLIARIANVGLPAVLEGFEA